MSSPQPKDTFDIDNVSGFYGPGAWAGALFAVATTWYSTLRHPERSPTPSLLAPLLFTNWAAIDLLVQMQAAELATAPTAAALTVTFWGLLHMLYQQQFIPFRGKESKIFRGPRTLLQAGCIVPILALGFASYRTRTSKTNDMLVQKHVIRMWTQLFLLWKYSCRVICKEFLTPFERVSRGVMLVSLLCYVLLFVLDPFTRGPERSGHASCFSSPCAPQSIKEWDQAFSLLFGLTLFVYEVGPDVWAAARKRKDDVLPVYSDAEDGHSGGSSPSTTEGERHCLDQVSAR